MHGVIGLLAALRVRDQTGIGQHVDIARMDVMTFSSDHNQAILDDAGHEPRGAQLFDAAGGPILLAGENEMVLASAQHRARAGRCRLEGPQRG